MVGALLILHASLGLAPEVSMQVGPEPSAELASSEKGWPAVEASRRVAERRGMIALTGWAGVNLVGGSLGAALDRGPARWFHGANAAWNSVNLALGVAGWVQSYRGREAEDLTSARRAGRRKVTIFAVNLGLDVVYAGVGGGLLVAGARSGDPRRADPLLGIGGALIFQGAFLMAFDAGMAALHADFNGRLELSPALVLSPEQRGVQLRLRF